MLNNVLGEAVGAATGLGALVVGWCGFRYTEHAQSPFSWSGVSELTWDHRAEISAAAEQSRAELNGHACCAMAAWLSAAAIASGLAVAHTGNRLTLIISASILATVLAVDLALGIRLLLALRLSRAREAFDCFYIGTGLCKYENVASGLERFARENPGAFRIVHRSIIADQTAGVAERDRQAEAYAEAMERALA